MANMLPGLVEQMLLAACSKDGITLDFKDEGIAGISLEELSDEEDDVNGDDIDISLSANSNDLDNIKSINVENAYKEEKETAIAMLKVPTYLSTDQKRLKPLGPPSLGFHLFFDIFLIHLSLEIKRFTLECIYGRFFFILQSPLYLTL